MIRAIIFDVDGVLLDSFDSNLKFIGKLLQANGYKAPTRKEFVPLFYVPLRDVIITLTGAEGKKIDEIIRYAKNANLRTMSPLLTKGASVVVKQLSKEYELGIATGRIKLSMFEKPLDSLKPFFKAAVCYEDTEKHKPDPEPLLLAAEKLGVPPEECVYVGDAEADMLAAAAAGMKFIHFSNASSAEFQTSSFRQIPVIIDRIINT